MLQNRCNYMDRALIIIKIKCENQWTLVEPTKASIDRAFAMHTWHVLVARILYIQAIRWSKTPNYASWAQRSWCLATVKALLTSTMPSYTLKRHNQPLKNQRCASLMSHCDFKCETYLTAIFSVCIRSLYVDGCNHHSPSIIWEYFSEDVEVQESGEGQCNDWCMMSE